jgi:hypothetical protein
MHFLAPAAFAFAAAIPVVIVFYLLKRKRVVKLVSSTLLWQKFLADTQANAPFQKLRHNWLLLLQIALLVLAVLALARPYRAGQAKQSRLRVIVLDASASMQATDEKPSRFEAARKEALQWVEGLQQGEQMMVLLAGATTEVKQSPTREKAALRRALQACAVSDAPTRLAEALKTASAFTYEKRGEEEVTYGEIHLFSDGAFPPLGELENKNLPLVYHKFGLGRNNAGIVTLDVRANPEDPTQRAVFVGVANFATNALSAELELSLDGRRLETRPLDLAPTNTLPLVFLAPQTKDGVFTVRLLLADDLAADNQASIVSFLPQPAKVLLVTRGNRFLENALRSAHKVELSVAPTLADPGDKYDFVVLDDVIPAVWPRGNLLAIHVANTNWFPGWEALKSPAIVDWKNTHPLLRSVNFDNVQVAETLAVQRPAWGIALVESPQTPLVVAGEFARQRLLWLGFDTLQSTWPLRISFPIFIANAVEWLNPASASAAQKNVRAGDPFRLALADHPARAEITLPDGSQKSMDIPPEAPELVFGDTARQGIYKVKAGTNDFTFCVDLLDSTESNITPREELPFGKYAKVAATTLKRANVELWRWAALLGLGVLLFEWWYYHKRTV